MDRKSGQGFILECHYPWIVGAGCVLLLLLFARTWTPPNQVALLTAATTLSSISIGFLAAAIAILIAIDEDVTIGDLKKVEHYPRLVRYAAEAIKTSFGLAIASGAGLFIDSRATPSWLPMAFAGWAGLTLWTVLALYRVIHVLVKILMVRANRTPRSQESAPTLQRLEE